LQYDFNPTLENIRKHNKHKKNIINHKKT